MWLAGDIHDSRPLLSLSFYISYPFVLKDIAESQVNDSSFRIWEQDRNICKNLNTMSWLTEMPVRGEWSSLAMENSTLINEREIKGKWKWYVPSSVDRQPELWYAREPAHRPQLC